MKRALIFMLLLTMVSFVSFSSNAVEGGLIVSDENPLWRHVVSLNIDSDKLQGQVACTGVLWGKYGILTAAHCVESASGIVTIERFLGGRLHPDDDIGFKITSKLRYQILPSYHGRGSQFEFANDLALIVVKNLEFSDIYSAPLYASEAENADLMFNVYNASIVGASSVGNPEGKLTFTKAGEAIKYSAVLRFTLAKLLKFVPDPKFYAYGIKFRSQLPLCKGDSGTPIFNDRNFVVGLAVSDEYGGEGKCSNELRAVMIAPHLPWIRQSYRKMLLELDLVDDN